MIYRANREYSAVLLDRLPPDEQAALRSGHPDGDVYGALVPRAGSDLAVRSLSFETALLFFALLEPGPLPAFAARSIRESGTTVQRLLLDGVLEVADGDGFVSGPRYLAGRVAAAQAVEPPSQDQSIAALRYAQALGPLPEDDLALRLYGYGRRPLSPALRRRLPDRAAVASALGADRVGDVMRACGWMGSEDEHWYHWLAPRPDDSTNADSPQYKLYVSPLPAETREALDQVVRACGAGAHVIGFKVAAGLGGFCRPDRVVAYFADFAALSAFAEELSADVAGCSGVAVPFTAPISADGLLSWGADPPRPARGVRSTSWRMWLCRRLAHYLRVARAADTGALEPWQFALHRLQVSGIDATSWTPSPASWTEVLETG